MLASNSSTNPENSLKGQMMEIRKRNKGLNFALNTDQEMHFTKHYTSVLSNACPFWKINKRHRDRDAPEEHFLLTCYCLCTGKHSSPEASWSLCPEWKTISAKIKKANKEINRRKLKEKKKKNMGHVSLQFLIYIMLVSSNSLLNLFQLTVKWLLIKRVLICRNKQEILKPLTHPISKIS